MRRFVAPSAIVAVIGLLAGFAYRYFANDSGEAILAN